MGLHNSKRGIFVNISKGKFTIKKDNVYEQYDNLIGRITEVDFRIDEYQNKKFEVAIFTLVDNIDTYILKIRVDSGYFRAMCNALKTGDINKIVKLRAVFKESNGKKETGMYVFQNDKALKHAHTKDNLGDMPPMEKVVFKGEETWDNTKQLQFWKDWLKSLKFEQEKVDQTEIFDEVGEVPFSGEFDEDLPF